MTILWLFRILIAITLVIFAYAIYKYVTSSRRKLYKAKNRLQFYFLDESNRSKASLKFVYKGGLFTGEKHFGLATDTFGVLKVVITVQNYLDLQGLKKDDLTFLEKEIHNRYPHAKIKWASPINQLVEPTAGSSN